MKWPSLAIRFSEDEADLWARNLEDSDAGRDHQNGVMSPLMITGCLA
ncbi:hypothetical protein ABZ307_30655 [Streptomyces griseorubiginosus]